MNVERITSARDTLKINSFFFKLLYENSINRGLDQFPALIGDTLQS